MEDLEVKDANGAILKEGDTVVLTQTLNPKGTKVAMKRGTKVKRIRLTEDPDEIEGKIEGVHLVIKTCYVKKAK